MLGLEEAAGSCAHVCSRQPRGEGLTAAQPGPWRPRGALPGAGARGRAGSAVALASAGRAATRAPSLEAPPCSACGPCALFPFAELVLPPLAVPVPPGGRRRVIGDIRNTKGAGCVARTPAAGGPSGAEGPWAPPPRRERCCHGTPSSLSEMREGLSEQRRSWSEATPRVDGDAHGGARCCAGPTPQSFHHTPPRAYLREPVRKQAQASRP